MDQSYLRMMMKVRHLDHPYSTQQEQECTGRSNKFVHHRIHWESDVSKLIHVLEKQSNDSYEKVGNDNDENELIAVVEIFYIGVDHNSNRWIQFF